MSEPLKYMYNAQFFEHLCPIIKEAVPNFGERTFVYQIFDKSWPELELKQRTRQVTKAFGASLPSDYAEAVEVMLRICRLLQTKKGTLPTYPFIFLPDYIEQFGLDHFDLSMRAIEESTKLVSAEFAIRRFIEKYPTKTMEVMLKWSKHPHAAVRRLSSEGCRPRLPWGVGLPQLKKDPSPILPILENLKGDQSDSVRRSVANNLNDIAKDHPEIALRLARKWKGISPDVDRTIKHGSRTLLKRGDPAVLIIHGFNPNARAEIKNFVVPEKVRIGQSLNFQFAFTNKQRTATQYRIDYAIDYVTRTGKKSTKVFKISEKSLPPAQTIVFHRNKSFADCATRVHYKGLHSLKIIANGIELAEREFFVL
jgi:3-methyladenine DNA glycosylase AlkC